MADAGHVETDKMLEKLEKRIETEYRYAVWEMKKKASAYLKQFDKDDKKQKALVKQGLLSQSDYEKWRLSKIATGKHWTDMRDMLADDLANTNLIARKLIGEQLKDVYALNYNYGTYEIEHGSSIDTSFTLYDHATVERLLKDNPDILPQPGKTTTKAIAEGKVKKWSKRQLQSVMTQSILQGETIPQIAERLIRTVGEMEESAAIRNARTMTTAAESAGRVDSYKRAEAMGIKMKQVWLATLDGRTRHEHRQLDGQMREVGKPFEVDGEEIMYPGDLSAPGYLVYNCRCTLIAAVEGSDLANGIEGVERKSKLGSMNYDEWKYGKEGSPEAIKAKISDIQSAISAMGGQVYSGIWKNDVTLADYTNKKDSIQGKKDYYNNQLDKYAVKAATSGLEPWEESKIDEINQKIKELYDFEIQGEKYAEYQKQLLTYKQKLKDMGIVDTPFSSDAYSEARLKAAMRFTDANAADKYHRPYLDSIWDNLSEHEKYSVWEYTHNSNPMNKALSGYEDGWSRYDFKGIGNADWGHEDKWRYFNTKIFENQFGVDGHADYHRTISDLTKAINKSELPQDTWFVRGSDTGGLAGLLEGNIISFNDAKTMLDNGDINNLKSLLNGQIFQGHSFLSTGIAEGTGFGGEVSYRIYAPQGTHAIYAEPQSYYGNTIGHNEKIYKTGQQYNNIGGEAEVIFQRGTEYRITDISYEYGNYTVTMEVVGQPDYFKHGDEETFNGGATRHKK